MEKTQAYHLSLRGDAVLHRPAAPLLRWDALPHLTAAMRAIMKTHDGIGIAAPQVGEAIRVFLIAKELFPPDIRGHIPSDVFVNPTLLKKSFKRISEEEGCLSVPRVYGTVTRPLRVTVEAKNAFGKKFRLTAEGLLGRAIQHELDHLDGTLFVEKAAPNTLHELLADGTVQTWRLS